MKYNNVNNTKGIYKDRKTTQKKTGRILKL